MRLFGIIGLAFAGCVALTVAGCSDENATVGTPDERFVELDLDRRATDDLVGYYMGAFLAPEAKDPFDARLVVLDDGKYFVDVEALSSVDSVSAERLLAAAVDDRKVDWDAFAGFVSDTYRRARRIPESRSVLAEQEGFVDESAAWMKVDVIGVMTTQRRRVFVRQADVVEALRSYRSREDRVIYPAGTVFIADHLEGGEVTETTVMRKTDRGDWDFFGYDRDGDLVDSTLAMPDARHIPTQCVGCHFGRKLYEPERSFPATVADGPHGPRAIFTDNRDATVVRYFDEHRNRSDRVLGLYATILVSRLRSEREAGGLDRELADLLAALDL